MDDVKGIITDIQGFSTDNGPGIRTTVFLKGCALRCPWCHNPETLFPAPQLLFYPQRCLHCGRCISRCPRHCHTDDESGHTFQRAVCTACGSCVSVCPAEALVMAGKEVRVGEVMSRIMADKPYYDLSGGGLSLSGGEPLLQADFCAELAKRCSFEGIRTLVDTSACVPYSRFEAVRPYVREYYVDLKCPDEAAYRRHTGGSLTTVLDNLHRLSDDGADITVRIPIIPHVNDTPEACAHMARHLDGIAVKAVHLLPFHKLGLSKYQALGLIYPYAEVPSYSVGDLLPLLRAFSSYPVSIAG